MSKIPGLQRSEEDIKVREQIKDRDFADIKKVKDDYEREEQELKQFFGDLKKPVDEDPTVIRKQKYDQKMEAYKQAMDGLDLRKLVNNFWKFQPATPEEIETLDLCRNHIKTKVAIFGSLGLAVTGLTCFKNRRYFGVGMYAFSFMVGAIGGSAMGIIQSTEYTLKKLETLGPDFALGRMAINEIEDFRMDKKQRQKV